MAGWRRRMGVLGQSTILFALLAVAFIAVVVALTRARNAENDAVQLQAEAGRVAEATDRIALLLVDIDAAEQVFASTGDVDVLAAHAEGQRLLPDHVEELRRLDAAPGASRQAAELSALVDVYIDEWLGPVLAAAGTDPDAAVDLVATGEGQRRGDELESTLSNFRAVQVESALDATEEAKTRADRATRRAHVLLAVVLVVLVLSIVTTYHQVTRPTARLVDATTRFAQGDLTARVEPSGFPDLKTLAVSFNDMADAVETTRAMLARQSAELRAVLDSTNEGILVAGLEGELVFTNAAISRLWSDDLSIADVGTVADVFAELMAATDEPDLWNEVARQLAAQPDVELSAEFTMISSGRSFLAFSAPVRATDAINFGRIVVVRDITVEREAERVKEQFVATVSHELRTPLTSILGYLELITEDEDGLDDQQRHFLGVAERNARRLLDLVADLLIVSQIQSGQLTFELVGVDLAAIVDTAVETVRPQAEGSGLRLDWTGSPGVPIVGDGARLLDMVCNLLSNAVKFTPEGGRVQVLLDAADGTARMEVSDTGIGMSEDDRAQLFQRFFRATTARDASIPGTGLGLSICQAIVEGHGGSISVSSTVGVGTRFIVELPTTGAGRGGTG